MLEPMTLPLACERSGEIAVVECLLRVSERSDSVISKRAISSEETSHFEFGVATFIPHSPLPLLLSCVNCNCLPKSSAPLKPPSLPSNIGHDEYELDLLRLLAAVQFVERRVYRIARTSLLVV